MTESSPQESTENPERNDYLGIYENGSVKLSAYVNWPDGTAVLVRLADLTTNDAARRLGKVIIAGFGLAGRWIADIFDRHQVEYVIVERNQETVEAQRLLCRTVIEGIFDLLIGYACTEEICPLVLGSDLYPLSCLLAVLDAHFIPRALKNDNRHYIRRYQPGVI